MFEAKSYIKCAVPLYDKYHEVGLKWSSKHMYCFYIKLSTTSIRDSSSRSSKHMTFIVKEDTISRVVKFICSYQITNTKMANKKAPQGMKFTTHALLVLELKGSISHLVNRY